MADRRQKLAARRDRELTGLSALDLAQLMAQGTVSAEAVTRAHLERIRETEDAVQAWAHLDADYALDQAKALDRHRKSGRAIGPLHGLPVGVKDIIDVRGLPGENGTSIDAGRRPRSDASLVTQLREAGAVILGKTVTTELAVFHPGKTRNPHDGERTPGGSSSGSAAAVAARMTPLAIGTQTNGSVIRPASYCGIVGFKPGRGVISRRGVLTQSQILDTVGTMGRTIEDAALLADAIAGYDESDPAMALSARPQLLATALSRPPVRPALAFVKSPVWDKAEDDMREGLDELVDAIGGVDEVPLPDGFDRAIDLHRVIQFTDIAKNYGPYYESAADQLSETLRSMIEEGRRYLATEYLRAQDGIKILNRVLDEVFDRYDAILTPAVTGEAPQGLEATGSPIFCTLWTYCGLPAVTVPLLTGRNGLPIGVQLVGRRGYDGRLLRTARWLVEHLRAEVGVEHQTA